MQVHQPTHKEMEEYLKLARMCLTCEAPECHEFTPEGVDVCAGLPFWNGKPVTREMLVNWQNQLHATPAN
jgi:hypothetical protein